MFFLSFVTNPIRVEESSWENPKGYKPAGPAEQQDHWNQGEWF